MPVNPKLEAILNKWGDPEGWDSLEQIQIGMEIEEAFDIDLGGVWVKTREELEELVERKLNENKNR